MCTYLTLSAMGATLLKQGTSATVKLGPFVDASDGVTPVTDLTLAFADVRLSANGGDFVPQDDGGGPNAHDEFGYYDVVLNAADTATLGRLRIAVTKSGTVPVWQDFMVVPAATYDSLVAGSEDLWLTADDVETAESFVDEMDANSTRLAAIDNNALNASDNSDVLISRLTATRAGYLDKLNITGNVASAGDIGSLESHGDSNWSTATGFAEPGDAMTLTGGERTAVGSAVASHATVAGISTAVTTTIPGLIGTPSETLADDIAGIETGSGLDAAGVREAIGLASANLDTQLSGIVSDTEDIQSRLPASLSGGRIVADVTAISGDSTAADNAERFFDGSGYGVHPFAGTVSGASSQTSINITGQSVPSTSGSLVGMTAGFVSATGGDEGGPVRSYRTIVASSFSTDTLSLTLDSAPDFTVGSGTGIEILPPGFSQTDRAAMLTADDVETAESFVGELLDAAPGLDDVFTLADWEAAIDGADSTDDIASASATAVWSATTRETTGGTVTTVGDKTGYALSASGVSAVQEGLGTVGGQGALNNAINQVINDIDGVGTLVNSRLTTARAGYLDKLNVGGNVASAADVGSLESHGDSNWATATTVDLNTDQSGVTIGAINGVSFPTNFADLAIEAGTGAVAAEVEAVQLSPEDIQAIAASVEGDWTADEKSAMRAILGVPSTGTTPETPASGILATIGTATGTTLPGLIGSPATTLAGDIAGVASDIGEVDVDTEAIAAAVAAQDDIASALAAIGTNLDAAVSTRSTLDGTGVRSALDAHGYTTARAALADKLNVAGTLAHTGNATTFKATGFAEPGDAMTLTSGERASIGAAVVANESLAGALATIGTNLDAAVSDVKAAAESADAKLGTPEETITDAIAAIEVGSGLTAQQVRDAMLLAPSEGAAAGSIDAMIDGLDSQVRRTIDPNVISDARTWRFAHAQQVASPKYIIEAAESGDGNGITLAMRFAEALNDGQSIDTVDLVTVTVGGNGTPPTVVSKAPSPDMLHAHVTLDMASATVGRYVVSVTVTSTDSQEITRRGVLLLE